MLERVLITGASSGIGAAAARAFARKGSRLFLVARRRDKLTSVAERCRKEGSPEARIATHDFSVPGEGKHAVEACVEALGGLDVLACNAGYGLFGPVARIHPAKMARIWQVNYQSAYESIHEALPHFLTQGSGHILLTSSILGKKGMAFGAPYSATKFAQVGLGESLWGELRDKGIGVTVICPGYTKTEFHEASELPDGTGPSRRRLKGQSPDEVADAMVASVIKKRREVVLTGAGKALMVLNRIWPGGASRVMAQIGSKARGARVEPAGNQSPSPD